MNKVILMGRLTKDPIIRNGNDNSSKVARYTLAVDRARTSKDAEQQADFISCVAFGKGADFAEKYLTQGKKIIVEGRIQTGSYMNANNERVYTTDVVVEHSEFAESKKAAEASSSTSVSADDFMNIPDDADDDEGLPFC